MPVASGTLSILEKWRSLRYYLLLPDAHGLVRETKLTHNEQTKGKPKTASQWRCQEWRILRERWINDLGWWTLKGRNVSTLIVERNKDRAGGVAWTQVPAFRALRQEWSLLGQGPSIIMEKAQVLESHILSSCIPLTLDKSLKFSDPHISHL